ncbi:MAG: DUF86 domain-containing protein [Candidatus Lokiarchaeota archaeon]|nr:DUF86 domain-containing protein [Candidatus Lokiarchaeota archaeon]
MDQVEIQFTDSKGETHTATYDRDRLRIAIILEDAVSVDLAGLAGCEKLQELAISSCDILTEIDLSQVGALKDLEKVKISFNHLLRKLGLTHLADCEKLQTLEIDYCNGLETLILPPSPTLNRIIIEELNIFQNLDLSPVSQCHNLHVLAIRRCKILRLSNLSALAGCRQLEKLLIEKLGPERWDLTPLSAVENLQNYSDMEHDDFKTSERNRKSVTKTIENIAQAIIDIGSHIAAQKQWGIKDTYREIIELLAEKGVISKSVGERLKELVSMRNLLIHQYLDIDYDLIWSILPQLIKDSEEFVDSIQAIL